MWESYCKNSPLTPLCYYLHVHWHNAMMQMFSRFWIHVHTHVHVHVHVWTCVVLPWWQWKTHEADFGFENLTGFEPAPKKLMGFLLVAQSDAYLGTCNPLDTGGGTWSTCVARCKQHVHAVVKLGCWWYSDVVVSAEVGIGSMDLVSLFVHKREASACRWWCGEASICGGR